MDTIDDEQLHRLGAEFLGIPYDPDSSDFEAIEIAVHQSDMFLAWLWFDYQHNGTSLLEAFAESDPAISRSNMVELRRLITTHLMSIFEVGDVKPGNIALTDLRTGTTYRVHEYSMASQVRSGQHLILRIAQQGERWVIMMPDGSIMGIEFSGKMLQDITGSLPEHMTIKDTLGYVLFRRDVLGVENDAETAFVSKPLSMWIPLSKRCSSLYQH